MRQNNIFIKVDHKKDSLRLSFFLSKTFLVFQYSESSDTFKGEIELKGKIL